MSSWSEPKRRELVEEDGWESSCLDLGYDIPRMDELMEGVGQVLSRQPDIGTQISANLWGIATRPWPGAPEVVIYYSFDDDKVYLQAVGEPDREETPEDEVPPDDES